MTSDDIKTDEETSLAGGHMPVMLEETIELLNVRPKHLYIDATAGAGGI